MNNTLSSDCPLPYSTQTRNLCIFAANWALIYFASPVTYVGVLQATLVNQLGFTDKEANLPAGVYLWMAPLAVMILCRFPQARMLKPLMIGAFAAATLLGMAVAAALFSPHRMVLFAALVAYAVVWGCGNGLIASCQWEMVGRGVAESRRGTALALAFGAGPVLAVIASLVSQTILGGAAAGFTVPFVPHLEFPWNFAALYGASVPIMLLGALISSFYVLPPSAVEPPRRPWLESVFGGLSEFVGYRVLLVATIAYVLVYSGHEVLQNLSLYASEAFGARPSDYAGLQMTLRFGAKIVAGFALAWLLVCTHPKMLLIATATLTLSAVIWTLVVPGKWYLAAFAILGAGELFGVYYLNYIVGCSAPEQMRRNIGFASMATMLVGFAPVMYGAISDAFEPDKKFGFQMSFVAASALLVTTITLVATTLPAQPKPRSV
jgi:MFS family permease